MADLPETRWRVYHCDLVQMGSGSQFWLQGPQVRGLVVGDRIWVSDTYEEPGEVSVFACTVSSVEAGGVRATEQPYPHRGISDYRVLRVVEPRGVRTYLLLVVDGRSSVVRLTAVLERRQTPAEMAAQLDRLAEEWTAKLSALSVVQQRRFAAAVDETTDPNMLLEDVQGAELSTSIAPQEGYEDGES